jgi:hypothetical protein
MWSEKGGDKCHKTTLNLSFLYDYYWALTKLSSNELLDSWIAGVKNFLIFLFFLLRDKDVVYPFHKLRSKF